MKVSRSEFISIRGLRYHVRHWGDADAPVLFMLHGWMDVSATFQFLVDAMERDVHIVAPDWRGFGQTEYVSGSYWFPDYLADLDALIAHYAQHQQIDLLGHSLGANVAGMYAGIRPQSVRRLILLEGFGKPSTLPTDAPQRYAQWLDEVCGTPVLRSYASQAEVAMRLQKNNKRLSDQHAAFLARHWAAQKEDGRWHLLADAHHRWSNPVLYRIDEVLACWQQVQAPVLWVDAAQSELLPRFGNDQDIRTEIARRKACLGNVRSLTVEEAGHMLHHDQPASIAAAIDAFLA